MVDMDVATWVDQLGQLPFGWVLAALLFASWIEYVCPPVPGDTLVVAGAALVGALNWPVAPIVIATTVGALLGAMTADAFGRWLAQQERWRRVLPERLHRTITALLEGFESRGIVLLATNRFLPGVRALFFVAAGMARWPRMRVMMWAAVSALAWQSLLVWVGLLVGWNLDLLATMVARYTSAAGAGVLLGAFLVGWWVRRRLSSE